MSDDPPDGDRLPPLLHETVVNSSVDGILAFDLDCRYTLWNPAMERISGRTKDEVLGRCAFDLFPFLKEEGEDRFFHEALAGRTSVSKDRRYVNARGERGFFEGYYSPLRDAAGRVIGGLAIVHDITDRKAADAALHESEERFTKAFRASPDAVAISRLEDGTLLDVNDGFLRMTGHRRVDVLGRTTLDLNLWDDPSDRARLIASLREGDRVQGQEVAFRTRQGERRVALFSAEIIDLDRERCILSVVRDITDRKAREDSLRRLSGRLLRLQDDERRRLARDLHDGAGQTLAVLAMSLDRLRRTCDPRGPAGRRILSHATALADQCLREIRTLSYLLHPPVLDEIGLASAIRWYARGFSERSGLQVAVDLPRHLRRLPSEMETALFRILQESLSNIHRHSGSPSAAIRLALEEARIVLEVIDHGRGLPAAAMREHGAGGHDLGVGILGMRERVRQLGGDLEIVSDPRGTTIRTLLPLPPGRDAPEEPAKPRAAVAGGAAGRAPSGRRARAGSRPRRRSARPRGSRNR